MVLTDLRSVNGHGWSAGVFGVGPRTLPELLVSSYEPANSKFSGQSPGWHGWPPEPR